MKKIKIVIDKDIPHISEYIDKAFEAHFYSGNEITKKEIKEADALIIRTLTKCDANLLEGTNIKIIITATIGDDHIDKAYCYRNNIAVRTADACNSNAVVQYVMMSLFYLQNTFSYDWQKKTVGIIGVGNIGRRLHSTLKCLGVKTLLYDPPREEKEGKREFVSLEDIRKHSDIISIHTPLTTQGKYPTKNLLKDEFFTSSSKKIVLINSSRGSILSTETLLKWKTEGVIEHLILDVWENEPKINKDLLNASTLATPHIAGYSLRGKITATYRSIHHLNTFFKIKNTRIESIFSYIPKIQLNYNENTSTSVEKNIFELLTMIWDIKKDDLDLRSKPLSFLKLRANYPFRNEFIDINIKTPHLQESFKKTLRCLKVSFPDNYKH